MGTSFRGNLNGAWQPTIGLWYRSPRFL